MIQPTQQVTRLRIYQPQAGFTLVELLIALVLGLLVSAAALQIFYTSSVNARRQEAGSQIQDNAIFGLSDLQYRLRRINYGARASNNNDAYFMNHQTPQGGIVLTAPTGKVPDGKDKEKDGWTMGNLYGLKLKDKAISTDLLSQNASNKSSSNLSDPSKSDQLTIQYQSALDNTFDCQGRVIPKGYYVIERYFVRTDTSITPNSKGLACASAIYKYDEALAAGAGIDIKDYTPPSATEAIANNLDGNGTIVIPHVDYFRVLLGVSSKKNFATKPEDATIGYIPIPASNAIAASIGTKRITSIQIGLLVHSDNPVANNQANADLNFDILDKKEKVLNTSAQNGPKYLRNVYESTILFRNARGGV